MTCLATHCDIRIGGSSTDRSCLSMVMTPFERSAAGESPLVEYESRDPYWIDVSRRLIPHVATVMTLSRGGR